MNPTAVIADAQPWRRPLWILGLVGLLAGVGTLLVEGTFRRALLLVLYLTALGLALMTAHRGVPTAPDLVGGRGYHPPTQWSARLLHIALTVLYNVGVAVVVFAALLRADLIEGGLGGAPSRVLPVAMGFWLLLMALAFLWRTRTSGGVGRNWYTRAHGWFLTGLTLPLLLLALVMVTRAELRLGPFRFTEIDLIVLLLAGMLGAATQLFLALRLPTPWEMLRRGVRGDAPDLEGRRPETPPVLYAFVAALSALAILAFVLDRTGLTIAVGAFGGGRIAFLVFVLPFGLLVFFFFSAISIWREGRRGLYKKRIPLKRRHDLLVFGLSALAGTVAGGLMLSVQTGRLEAIGPLSGVDLVKDLVVLTIIVTVAPIGFYLHRQHQRLDRIEGRMADFLSDLAENRRAGLTLAASLQNAAAADYGALTPEVRKMANQVAWGVPFQEAMRQFAERVPSGLVRRSAYLVIEAGRTGGSISEILRAAARDAYELKSLEAERRSTMMTYLVVLYVVFAVFLVVVSVLDVRFIPQVLAANEAAAEAGTQTVAFAAIDQEQLRFIYFNAAIVQAIGNGLIGGVLSEGRVSAGFRHVAIMTALAWLLFRLVLPAF